MIVPDRATHRLMIRYSMNAVNPAITSGIAIEEEASRSTSRAAAPPPRPDAACRAERAEENASVTATAQAIVALAAPMIPVLVSDCQNCGSRNTAGNADRVKWAERLCAVIGSVYGVTADHSSAAAGSATTTSR